MKDEVKTIGERFREVRHGGIRLRTICILSAVLGGAATAGLLWTFGRVGGELDRRWPEMRLDVYQAILACLTPSRICAALLLGVLALTLLAVVCLVLVPLEKDIRELKGYEKIQRRGTYELRSLAEAYNAVFAETQRHSDHLLYQAEHDPLTSLFNRRAFDKLRAAHQEEHIGLMLIDVDKFKEVNDNYGHDAGDKVLQKVARLLSNSFRPSDYPCRVGGDEFAVIITNIKPSVKEVIRRKVLNVSAGLRDTEEDGLPVVTLSVGVAFSDQCLPGQDVYNLADVALYRVKSRGRNGCVFYDDEDVIAGADQTAGAAQTAGEAVSAG